MPDLEIFFLCLLSGSVVINYSLCLCWYSARVQRWLLENMQVEPQEDGSYPIIHFWTFMNHVRRLNNTREVAQREALEVEGPVSEPEEVVIHIYENPLARGDVVLSNVYEGPVSEDEGATSQEIRGGVMETSLYERKSELIEPPLSSPSFEGGGWMSHMPLEPIFGLIPFECVDILLHGPLISLIFLYLRLLCYADQMVNPRAFRLFLLGYFLFLVVILVLI